MIDLRTASMTKEQREALQEFFASLHRGLCAEGRMSELVHVAFGEFHVDFRITYLGPSRTRKRAAPDDGQQSKEKQR